MVASVGEAEVRIQDILFGAFLLAVALGPAETRRMVTRTALSWTGLAATVFFFARLLLAQSGTEFRIW